MKFWVHDFCTKSLFYPLFKYLELSKMHTRTRTRYHHRHDSLFRLRSIRFGPKTNGKCHEKCFTFARLAFLRCSAMPVQICAHSQHSFSARLSQSSSGPVKMRKISHFFKSHKMIRVEFVTVNMIFNSFFARSKQFSGGRVVIKNSVKLAIERSKHRKIYWNPSFCLNQFILFWKKNPFQTLSSIEYSTKTISFHLFCRSQWLFYQVPEKESNGIEKPRKLNW